MRSLWRNHYLEADIILFVVDASDLSRVAEAREVLEEVLEESDGGLMFFVANKQDCQV